jgi:hypothetical protein
MSSVAFPSTREKTSPAEFRLAPMLGVCALALGGVLAAWQLARPTNWWAIFILLPAIGFLAAGGWIAFSTRRLHPVATILASPGIVTLAVALMFLASADWQLWWPMMLAAPGGMFLLIGISAVRNPLTRAWFRTLFAAGVMLAVFAGIFFADTFFAAFDHFSFHGIAWWGLPMLIPGLAALYNAVRASRLLGTRSLFGIRMLVAVGLSICAVAAATLEGASGNVQISVGLMAGGLGLLL